MTSGNSMNTCTICHFGQPAAQLCRSAELAVELLASLFLERAVGFEPTHCQVGSLVPYRLATPAQGWSREWDLNPRPRDYRSRALPTELSLVTAIRTGAGCRSRTRVPCL